MATVEDVRRYREYLEDEVDGIYMYRTLAELEEDESVSDVYRRLADAEQRHLDVWREQLRLAGEDDTPPGPSFRARTLMRLARIIGTDAVLPIIKTFESGATDMYTGDLVAEGAGLPEDEASHARIFAAIAASPTTPPGSVIGQIESRHRAVGGGNAIRAAVLGANDGLVSNLALVAGFAGATTDQGPVVLAGIAGLLAGAGSMAIGEWISVTSSREAAEAQLALEAEELRLMPESEQQELAIIYQAKGLPQAEAEQLAARIIADRETALGTLAREELGIVPEELGSPWVAAIASFVLFALGAVVPVVPFLFAGGYVTTIVSAIASGAALFALGAAITLLTGKSALFSGARQLGLGLAAAAITFVIGTMIGGAAGV